jgi:hypothetical protein
MGRKSFKTRANHLRHEKFTGLAGKIAAEPAPKVAKSGRDVS